MKVSSVSPSMPEEVVFEGIQQRRWRFELSERRCRKNIRRRNRWEDEDNRKQAGTENGSSWLVGLRNRRVGVFKSSWGVWRSWWRRSIRPPESLRRKRFWCFPSSTGATQAVAARSWFLWQRHLTNLPFAHHKANLVFLTLLGSVFWSRLHTFDELKDFIFAPRLFKRPFLVPLIYSNVKQVFKCANITQIVIKSVKKYTLFS